MFLFKYINANIKDYIPNNQLNLIKNYKLYLNSLYFTFLESILEISNSFPNAFREDIKNLIEINDLPKKSKIYFFIQNLKKRFRQ